MATRQTLVELFYRSHHQDGCRLDQSFMEKERADLFNQWIGTGKSVLDLGCRDGHLTRHYTTNNQVTGGDIDTDALCQASSRYGIQTRRVDLNSALPFQDSTFDVVVLAEVLEYLPYPSITLLEIYRVLKSEGIFIGNVPLAYHLVDRWKVLRGKKLSIAGDKTHLQFYRYEDVIRLFKEQGFIISKIKILKGEKLGRFFPSLFARNIAFFCKKNQ